MDGQRELPAWLRGWAAASEAVECAPSETCLTTAQIAEFVDNRLEPETRERAATHLSQCSFCVRAVGSLYGAVREFEDQVRVQQALGSLTSRVSACLRVFVDEARGAFTRADALLQGLAAPFRLDPVLAPAGLAAATRGEDLDEEDADNDPDALHEVALRAEGLPGADVLCGEEEEGGSITVSLEAPCEVRLVAPDGTLRSLALERGADRYYATVTGLPPGEYLLTVVPPENG